VRLSNGVVGAQLTLKIDKSGGGIPIDSRVVVRPRSLLGLKYVELTRGKSRRTFVNGATMPVANVRLPVDLDRFYGMFDRPTRRAVQGNLEGFGNAFAMRGQSLNRAIEEAPRFLGNLAPVMRTLAAPDTKLARFFKELGDVTRVIAPIAPQYARTFTAAADTLEAWSRRPASLRGTLERSAPTMEAGIRSLRVQRPFLEEFARFSHNMRRATDQLDYALPRLTPALVSGAPVLRRSVDMNERTRASLRAARGLFMAPGTGIALRGLSALAGTLAPTLRYVGPFITVCNYWNYAWTHAGEHITEPDPTGYSQRTNLNQPPRQDNSPGSIGAAAPANGQHVLSGNPANHHANVYSAAIDRQGKADCEAGQKGYVKRANLYGAPGMNIAIDPHIPGDQGPTYTGLARVPRGETFSRIPMLGPQIPRELDP
jgi:ABC-type transporter Mla subunit MlaD